MWIASGGGPLILLDRQWLKDWQGHELGTHVTDYDRACAVEDTLAILPVGVGQGLILGDEPFATAWYPDPTKRSGILIQWRYAPVGTSVVALLEPMPAINWTTLPFAVPIPSGDAILFDSADDGASFEDEEYLTLQLIPGNYCIDTAEYAPIKEIALLFHRLTSS